MNHEENQDARFVVCIRNTDYPASLEVGKIYRVIPDASAEAQGYLCVVGESGEAYGYGKDRFFAIELPLALQVVLAQAA